MNKFELGDRVMVYDTMIVGGKAPARVVQRAPKPPFIAVCFEQPVDHHRDYYVHPCQCRKVRKK